METLRARAASGRAQQLRAYVARRLLHALAALFGITISVFLLIHLVPGDPATYLAHQLGGRRVTPEILQAIRHEHHLDQPIYRQYVYWVGGLVRLDLGHSTVDDRPVSSKIGERLPNTLELNLVALILAILIGVPLAVAAAAKPDGLFDRGAGALSLLFFSIPNFWIAIVLIEIAAVRLNILPLYGMSSDEAEMLMPLARLFDHVRHLVLPVTTLALGEVALFARFGRAALLDVLRSEFITAARARGVGRLSLLVHHGLRNALTPLITLLGVSIPLLLSGSVVVEKIFEWDGVGRLFLEASQARDYPMIMGLTLMTSVATLLSYLLTDLLYAVADPRVEPGATIR